MHGRIPRRRARDLSGLRREVRADSERTDSLAEMLEHRVATLEEIAAARWPRRWLLAARLGRSLRRSVRHMPGGTFAERRAEAVTADWIAR
jgi:hypothetical protein